jgi:hypothetical protein
MDLFIIFLDDPHFLIDEYRSTPKDVKLHGDKKDVEVDVVNEE